MEERMMVQQHLHLANCQLRSQRVARAVKNDIFGDNFVKPAKTQAGKLKVNPLGAQFIQQRFLYEAGQSDLIEVKQAADEHQNNQPHSDPEAAEIDSAQTPEVCLFLGWGHVRKKAQIQNPESGRPKSWDGLRNREVRDDVAVERSGEFKNPQIAVKIDAGVLETRGRLAAEFNRCFTSVFQLDSDLVSVIGESATSAILWAVASPGDGGDLCEIADGLFDRQRIDIANRIGAKRPLVRVSPNKLTSFTQVANRDAGKLIGSNGPESAFAHLPTHRGQAGEVIGANSIDGGKQPFIGAAGINAPAICTEAEVGQQRIGRSHPISGAENADLQHWCAEAKRRQTEIADNVLEICDRHIRQVREQVGNQSSVSGKVLGRNTPCAIGLAFQSEEVVTLDFDGSDSRRQCQ